MSDTTDPAQQLFDKIKIDFWEEYWDNYNVRKTFFNQIKRKKILEESRRTISILTKLELNYNTFFLKHGLASDLILLVNESSEIIRLFEKYGINYITTRDEVIDKVLSTYFNATKFDKVHSILNEIIERGINYYPLGGNYPLTVSHLTFLMRNIEKLFKVAVTKPLDGLQSSCIILIKKLNDLIIQTKNSSILQADEHIDLATILYKLKNKKHITFIVQLVKSGQLPIRNFVTQRMFEEYWSEEFKQYNRHKKQAQKLIKKGDYKKAIELLNVGESINPFVRYDGDFFYYRGVAYLKEGNELLAHTDWKRAYDIGSFQLKYMMEEFGVSIEDIENSIAEKSDS